MRFVKDSDNKPIPPAELLLRKKAFEKASARKGEDLNQVMQYKELDPDDDEPEWNEPPDEDEDYETSPEDERPGDTEKDHPEDAKQEDSEVEFKELNPLHQMLLDIPEDDLEEEAQLLAMASGDKSKFVCFNFANKGVCTYEKEKGKKCRYSHDPEDVKRYLALKQLGGVKGVRDFADRSKFKTNPTGGTAGLAGRSPGFRAPLPGSKPTGFGRPSDKLGGNPKRS
jgi:hypothetical protein